MASIRLIVGLGNPGAEYADTRHNAGCWFVDEIAWEKKAPWSAESKFLGEVAKFNFNGQDVWLLKPSTFMNRSGQSIAALARFYKINADEILIVHDELDLGVGIAKLKQGGGHGGHNGLKDSINHLGANFWRLRVGIDHPGDRNEVANYVLKKPRSEEKSAIDDALNKARILLPEILSANFAVAMKTLHTQTK